MGNTHYTRKLLHSEPVTSTSDDERCTNVVWIQSVFCQRQSRSNSTCDRQLHQNYQLRPSPNAEAVWRFTVVSLLKRVVSRGRQVDLLDAQQVVTMP